MPNTYSEIFPTVKQEKFHNMEVLFQTSVPTGKKNDNYEVVNDKTLQGLIEQLNQLHLESNESLVNYFDEDSQGNFISYVASRKDPQCKAKYEKFTPNNQELEIRLFIGTIIIDEITDKVFDEALDLQHLNLIPDFTQDNMLIQVIPLVTYNFEMGSI